MSNHRSGVRSALMTALRQRGAFIVAAFVFALITSELLASPVMLDCKRAPDYAFLAWEKSFSVESSGLHLRAGKGSGGGGFNMKLDVSAFMDWTPALQLTVNAGNQADRLRLILGDADGTSHEYAFILSQRTTGETIEITAVDGASLSDENAGKTEGKLADFDLAHITMIQVQGDWSSKPVDVLLSGITLAAPDRHILAERSKAAEQRARDAEKARVATEQKAARQRELLAGAPHPSDGPNIRHVATVAPDILVLTIQEKEFVPVPQVDYQPVAGDEIVRRGKEDQKVTGGRRWSSSGITSGSRGVAPGRQTAGQTGRSRGKRQAAQTGGQGNRRRLDHRDGGPTGRLPYLQCRRPGMEGTDQPGGGLVETQAERLPQHGLPGGSFLEAQ